MDPIDFTGLHNSLSYGATKLTRLNRKTLATRAFNALVVLSMLVPGIIPSAAVAAEPPTVEETITADNLTIPVPEIVGFQPPAFKRPEPRIGQHNSIAVDPIQIRGAITPIPLMFIENVGQFDSKELYRVRGTFSTVRITEDGIWATSLERPSELDDHESIEGRPIKGAHLRFTFPGSNPNPVIEGINHLDSQISYFYGNDPQLWKTNVPVWDGLRYKDLYPGVDLEISSERGTWTWRFILNDLESSNPGQIQRIESIASRIHLKIAGTKGITLNNDRLLLSTGFSELGLPLIDIVDSKGVSVSRELMPPGLNGDVINAPFQRGVQDRDDSSSDVSLEDSHLENQDSNANNSIGTGGKLTLIVAPQQFPAQIFPPRLPNPSGQDDLIYSTFLGGSSVDTILGIDINSAGEVYVTGGTASPDFPTTPGAFDTTSNGGGFITKFNNDASELVYSTFIGGGGATDIKVDGYGAAYVTGTTSSIDFPTTLGAFDTTHNGSSDAFILKLNSAGDQLVYSTFYGGSLADNGRSIAINEMGEAFITGVTSSTDLPTSPTAVQPVIAGGADVFAARISADGDQIIYSTYLGGSDADGFADIAIDALDSAYIAGTTSSTDYPTTSGAYQIVCASCPDDTDIFISKLSPDGNSLEYSTYLGGGDQEDKVALTVDPDGHAYITGVTIIGNQPDFPTTPGVFQPNSINLCDAFVTRLNLDGSQLDYSTFLGGRGCDEGKDIAIDAVGNAYVTGTTQDAFITPFPTTPDAFQPTYRGGSTDGFVSKINQDGTELVYSTFLGGSSIDEPWTIVVDPSGAGYIAGNTYSQDFPVSPNAFQTTRDEGSYDSFVTKLSMGAQESIVSERAVLDSAGAEICRDPETQGSVARPINTRTGAYDYSTEDISISTSAGPLTFQRTYASLGVDLYQDKLGPGWTHNHDIKLIFSDDPGGEPGLVRFKAQTTNQHDYIDNGDGTYLAAPGVCGTLVKDDGPPILYTLTDQGQNQYVFDENGLLLTFSDPSGHSWTYSYDFDGLLETITDDSGQRFLFIGYDELGMIEYVEDHTFRFVEYIYDPFGDLVALYDLFGEAWTYVYDTEHRLTEVVDPRGVTVERTEFDAQGRAYRQFNGEDELIVEITYNPDGTSTVTDARNNSATHTYDSRKTITDIEDPLGGSSDKVYDLNFRPTALVDEAGDVTQLSWSGDGVNLTGVLDAEGNQTDLTYNALNNLTSVVDPRDFLTTYAYSGTFLTSTTDALSNTTTYTYTPEGYLESVTDARNNTTSYGYDSLGQRTSMTEALNNTWTYTYDDLGRLIDTTDPHGRVTHNDYDEAGRLIKVTRNYDMFLPQNALFEYNIVTEYEYDEVGNQTLVRDTFGTETCYEYDDANRLVTTRDFLGNETTNVYDDAGNLVSTTDALNRTTTYVYDELNHLVTTIDPIGESTSTAYNPDGTVASTTDALNRTTTYTYDSLKRVVSTENPLGGDTATVYDEAGNVVSTTDAENRTTTYEYDALGRLILQTDPLNGETEHFYDEVGNRVQTIDANNHATTYAYDDLNRLETVTDARGKTTTYVYDAAGNRTAVTNARDYTTNYVYDDLDRLIEVEDPLGNITETQYDALSNVFLRTDANDNPTIYTYDILNRLVLQADAEGGLTQFTYDAVGNQLTMKDANNHTTTTVYDDLNRPITVTDPLGNTTMTVYDEVGNVTSVTDDLNNTMSFVYDDLNRQESVTDPESHTTHYGYDSVGNRNSMTDANGIETRYEYDDLNRLTAVVENYEQGTDPDQEYNVRTEYGYDAVGNRLTIRDGNNDVTTFVYNELNQLTQEEDAVGIRNYYFYDSVGNRTKTQDHNDVPTHYWFDAANRLTFINYPSPDPDVDFDYDAGGNRIEMVDGVGITEWDYDGLNRVTSVIDPYGDTVGYGYDGVGNRTELTYPDLKFVEYTYDAANRMTEVLDWDSQTTSYTYDDANRLLTTLLPNSVTSSYAYDDAGNVLNITHATATDTLSSFAYTYDAVGNRTQVVEYYKTPGGGPTVTVSVADEYGFPMSDLPVYVFDGVTYTNFNEITDLNGEASITLPEGSYRFRVDVDGVQYWSGATNHCAIPGCTSVIVTIPDQVDILVMDTNWNSIAGVPVYVFDGATYTGINGTTDDFGWLSLQLPEGNYRFRADYDGVQFWSWETNQCSVPGCNFAVVQVTVPVTVNVEDSMGMPQEGIPVYVFDDATYTGYNGVSDVNGEVSFTLPVGDYRFRADSGGTQFWSDDVNHCTIPGCMDATVVVTVPVTVTVEDTNGVAKEGVPVFVFDGAIYTEYTDITDVNGEVAFTLPEGSYRFRADYDGTQFWSGEANHCAVPGCSAATVQVMLPVTVTVEDTDGVPKESVPVYVFDGSTYTEYTDATDVNGEVSFTLPPGSYRFRADYDGIQFWSDDINHCDIPGCETATVVVTKPVVVTVEDTNGVPKESVSVYVFDDATYTYFNDTTDVNGGASFTLPMGDYRFRADYDGTQFWSGGVNHCTIPGCETALVVVTLPVTVTVEDGGGAPLDAVPVYVFDGATYTGENGSTDIDGEVDFTLVQGSYRFRADYGGEQYWSGAENHCDIPGCEAVTIVAGEAPAPTATPTPTETPTLESTPTNTPTPVPTPTPTDTPEPTATPTPTESASVGRVGLMAVVRPVPAEMPLLNPDLVTVTVEDTNGDPKEGLSVYVFDNSSYTGHTGISDVNGEVDFDLPDGSYRFRADMSGTQFWTGEVNHCDVPGCAEATVVVTIPVTVTVQDTNGTLKEGVSVYAFDGAAYTGYSGVSDVNGEVELTLPQGDYRFRADYDGTQFWSDSVNHCTIPGCGTATVEVTLPVTVTVLNTDALPQVGLPVYVFDGATYTGFNDTTDVNGEVSFTLPPGDYHFRADLNGTQFWSDIQNDCTIPGCETASIAVTIPVTVTVGSQTGTPYPDLPVYVFSGEAYTGFNGTSDVNGQAVFTLPVGDYHFRSDYDGVQFWSDSVNHCTIPGCLEATVEIPGGTGEVDVTIDYYYDPLYRLTEADYSTGEYFWYTYDAVGNRLTQETHESFNTYVYDDANKLTEVDGVTYTWDVNGNLLSDGASTYTYNYANRLTSVVQGVDEYEFEYSGLGDRLSQSVNDDWTDYTLDLATGLTQVLADGTNGYLYGNGRLGEEQSNGWQYHQVDALGSVRQLTDSGLEVKQAESYQPFGKLLIGTGATTSSHGFTGEWLDLTGLMYLRARYYQPLSGGFISRDLWRGIDIFPMSLQPWLYAYSNPIRYSDPSGHYVSDGQEENIVGNSPRLSTAPKNIFPQSSLPDLSIFSSLQALEITSDTCDFPIPATAVNSYIDGLKKEIKRYGIDLGVWKVGLSDPEWQIHDLLVVKEGIMRVSSMLNRSIDPSRLVPGAPFPGYEFLFREIYSGLTIYRGPYQAGWEGVASLDGNSIRLYGLEDIWTTNKRSGLELVIHELGHILDFRFNESPSDWVEETFFDPNETYKTNVLGLGVGKATQESVEEAWADAFASLTLDDYITKGWGPAVLAKAEEWKLGTEGFVSSITTRLVKNWQIFVWKRYNRVIGWH